MFMGREVMVNMTANDNHAFGYLSFDSSRMQFRVCRVRSVHTMMVGPLICAELVPTTEQRETKFIVETPEAFEQWLKNNKLQAKSAKSKPLPSILLIYHPARF